MTIAAMREQAHELINKASEKDVPHVLAILQDLLAKPLRLIDNEAFMSIWEDQKEISKIEKKGNNTWTKRKAIFDLSKEKHAKLTA